MTRRMVISPLPTTIQFSMAVFEGKTTKAGRAPAFHYKGNQELLLGSDGVLGGLGDAEFHHRLRLDLDRFAGLRIAANASLAVRLHQASQAGHHEDAVLFGFFNSGIRETLQERRRGFIRNLVLFGELPNQLGFGQTCSHSSSSTKISLIPARVSYTRGLWKNTLFHGGFLIHTRGGARLYRRSGGS